MLMPLQIMLDKTSYRSKTPQPRHRLLSRPKGTAFHSIGPESRGHYSGQRPDSIRRCPMPRFLDRMDPGKPAGALQGGGEHEPIEAAAPRAEPRQAVDGRKTRLRGVNREQFPVDSALSFPCGALREPLELGLYLIRQSGLGSRVVQGIGGSFGQDVLFGHLQNRTPGPCGRMLDFRGIRAQDHALSQSSDGSPPPL